MGRRQYHVGNFFQRLYVLTEAPTIVDSCKRRGKTGGEATKTKAWLGAAAAVANSNARSEIKLQIEQLGDAAKQQISMPSTWLLTAQKDQSTSSAAGEEARGGMYLQYRNGCWLQ